MYDKVLYPNESLRAIDRLREAGVDRYVDLPRLLIFGWPSTKRIILLEELCGVRFPPQPSCDQFFLELNIRPSRPWIREAVAEITITPSAARSAQEVEVLEAFKRTFPLGESDLARFLDDARRALGIASDDPKRCRVKDVVRVDILGPGLPFVSLMHLPELRLHADNCTGPNCVDGLQYRYMRSPQSYMIPVLTPGKQQMSPAVLLLVAERANPSKERVQVALMDASNHWSWNSFNAQPATPFSTTLRREWNMLFRRFSQSCLPLVRQHVQGHVSDARAKIESLNYSCMLQSDLITARKRNSDLMMNAINGNYRDPFFHNETNSEPGARSRHLHAILQGVLAMFERTMRTTSRRRESASNTRDEPDQPSRQSKSTKSSGKTRQNAWNRDYMRDVRRRDAEIMEHSGLTESETDDPWNIIAHNTLTEIIQAIRTTAWDILSHASPNSPSKVMREVVIPKLDRLETELGAEIDRLLDQRSISRQGSPYANRADVVRHKRMNQKVGLGEQFKAIFGISIFNNPSGNVTIDLSQISNLHADIVRFPDKKLQDCAQLQSGVEDDAALQSFVFDFKNLILETTLPKKLASIFFSPASSTTSEGVCRFMECPKVLNADQDIARKKYETLERNITAFEDFLERTEPETQTDSTSEDMLTPSDSSCGYESESVSTSTIVYTPEESVAGT